MYEHKNGIDLRRLVTRYWRALDTRDYDLLQSISESGCIRVDKACPTLGQAGAAQDFGPTGRSHPFRYFMRSFRGRSGGGADANLEGAQAAARTLIRRARAKSIISSVIAIRDTRAVSAMQLPASSKRFSVELSMTPKGVGQPRSA